LFGNRWLPQNDMCVAPRVQAIFFRRRHQPRKPAVAKIKPGSPAPTTGPGTGAKAIEVTVAVAGLN